MKENDDLLMAAYMSGFHDGKKLLSSSRMLDDVRKILMQEINVYRVGRDWGFANAGIMSDGYWTKESAEIAARDAIIEAARAVAHVV